MQPSNAASKNLTFCEINLLIRSSDLTSMVQLRLGAAHGDDGINECMHCARPVGTTQCSETLRKLIGAVSSYRQRSCHPRVGRQGLQGCQAPHHHWAPCTSRRWPPRPRIGSRTFNVVIARQILTQDSLQRVVQHEQVAC